MKIRLVLFCAWMGWGVYSHHVFLAFVLAGVAGAFIGPPQPRRKAPVARESVYRDDDEVVSPAIRGVRLNPDPTRPS